MRFAWISLAQGTWNCSVKRAACFYEKRRLHELKVDQQLHQLQRVERRLAAARQRLADLQKESPVRRQSRQLDELSLQSFEIAGALSVSAKGFRGRPKWAKEEALSGHLARRRAGARRVLRLFAGSLGASECGNRGPTTRGEAEKTALQGPRALRWGGQGFFST